MSEDPWPQHGAVERMRQLNKLRSDVDVRRCLAVIIESDLTDRENTVERYSDDVVAKAVQARMLIDEIVTLAGWSKGTRTAYLLHLARYSIDVLENTE